MTNLDSILKSRDITLPTKVRLVKAVAFPVVSAEELMLLNCGVGEEKKVGLPVQPLLLLLLLLLLSRFSRVRLCATP